MKIILLCLALKPADFASLAGIRKHIPRPRPLSGLHPPPGLGIVVI